MSPMTVCSRNGWVQTRHVHKTGARLPGAGPTSVAQAHSHDCGPRRRTNRARICRRLGHAGSPRLASLRSEHAKRRAETVRVERTAKAWRRSLCPVPQRQEFGSDQPGSRRRRFDRPHPVPSLPESPRYRRPRKAQSTQQDQIVGRVGWTVLSESCFKLWRRRRTPQSESFFGCGFSCPKDTGLRRGTALGTNITEGLIGFFVQPRT